MEKIQIGNFETFERKIVYNDGELALIDNLHDLRSMTPCQLDIAAISLVQEGKATVNIDGTVYEAQKNDLFIGAPQTIVENGLLSLDFKGLCICVSKEYLAQLVPILGNSWDIRMFFSQNPKCSLRPEEAAVFCQYFDLLYSKTQQSSPVQKKVIDTLVLAFIYDMQNVLRRFVQSSPHPFTSSESLFNRFVDLVTSSFPKSRSISYYAGKLNVTPKYLSAVCKHACGRKASDVINMYVKKDIDYQLKHTRKSIKEIAYELNFPNISFFGKYVKKHFGMSPRAYREQIVKAH